MSTKVTHEVTSYAVRVFGNDLKGSVKRKTSRSVYMYAQSTLVCEAHFTREGDIAPDCTYRNGVIYYFAQGEQYAAVLDLLRNEKNVHISWVPKHDKEEVNDGDAVLHTSREVLDYQYG